MFVTANCFAVLTSEDLCLSLLTASLCWWVKSPSQPGSQTPSSGVLIHSSVIWGNRGKKGFLPLNFFYTFLDLALIELALIQSEVNRGTRGVKGNLPKFIPVFFLFVFSIKPWLVKHWSLSYQHTKRYIIGKPVQFSSVQSKMASSCSGKPICTPTCLCSFLAPQIILDEPTSQLSIN